jgi:tyrosyl-tRNA synthetase
MQLSEFLDLASMITHSKLIQRDMFQKRLNIGKEIYINEILYPLLQGYDSVMLKSDLTIVGTDQFFNENMGRFYQEKFKQNPQVIITTKITPGIDGKEKQSKSLGNYIALEDTPRDKFGKTMSIPDPLIVPYLEVYTTVDSNEVSLMDQNIRSNSLNPMEAKKILAHAIVERYHDKKIADEELYWFENVFSNRSLPSDLPIISVREDENLIQILKLCLPNHSKNMLKKLIEQGAISLDGNKIKDGEEIYKIKEESILKIGKRNWFKINIYK